MYYLRLYPKEGAPSLTSLSGLLDLGLFFHLLLAGTLLHVTWSFGLRLFRIFHTEVGVCVCVHVHVCGEREGKREREHWYIFCRL